MHHFVRLLMILSPLLIHVKGATWSFTGKDDGPSKWKDNFKTCSGNRQSPIDIYYGKANYNSNLEPISIKIINEKTTYTGAKYTMTNDGYGVKLEFPDKLWYANFGTKVQLPIAQLHFHWGKGKNNGSEHSINGMKTQAELHVVIYNSALYSTFTEAAKSPDGLAVLGTMVVVDDSKNSIMDAFPGFAAALSSVQTVKASTTITAFDLSKYTEQQSLKSYYRYPGSLTTPPCTENVAWTVFKDPVYMKTKELEALQSLNYGTQETEANIGDNFRPVISLNTDGSLLERQITRSWNNASEMKSSFIIISVIFLFIMQIY